MKLLSTFRYRRVVLGGVLFVVLSFGTMSQVFVGSAQAQATNAPAPGKPVVTTSPGSKYGPAQAPNAPATAGENVETDKETGKPVVTTPSGLKYVDIVVGTGPAVKQGDHVVVAYVGKLLDGTVFDASERHPDMGPGLPYQQGVTSLIQGWTEGTSTMKVGGKRKLIIPPQLGYGLQGQGDVIPPNATLIFEVEMISDADAK